ncbi:alpha/beta hydrolase family protein [Mycobacteroides abscessus subsp. abscessus]|uniref:alpha/beta hydrolase n=1 Tax=Mycobacteroides abscessus TaxID=36809 RepID=UPI0018964908|nr:alpha/beta hydrolase [Mycobacteroides abscessus]UEA22802.1 alpha/beta hydrolase family protein [Mycobacteroides abscessus subsp. abscessus]
MELTPADVLRWEPESIRDVKAALTKRGASAQEVADGLKQLPIIASWEGESGAAMKESLDKLGKYLLDHSEEMDKLGKSLDKSANEVDIAKNAVKSVIRKADSYHLEVDLATGSVSPTSAALLTAGNATNVMLRVGEVQQDMKQAMDLANIADQDLAGAVKGIGSAATGPAESRPNIYNALSQPLPSDPKEFRELWDQLTPTEKDWLYSKDHFIGNHPGMPFEDKDGRGKDYYNRQHLPELQAQAQSEVDRIKAVHPTWAENPPIRPTREYDSWRAQLDGAERNLKGYGEQMNMALGTQKDGIRRYLGFIDDKGHVAISKNNPDNAQRVATYVPGTGQDMSRFQFSAEKSDQMWLSAMRADADLGASDVSVTTWMGYDRPMNLWEAKDTGWALGGAQALDDYQSGLRASHNGAASINTVIGHSYGSTLAGAAATNGHFLDANNFIAVGSPGVLADNANQLNLDPGANVYATRARHDIISFAGGWTLGISPTEDSFGAHVFGASPGPTTGPGFLQLPSLAAHSSYWDSMENPALINMGRVIVGNTDVIPPR